MSLNKFLKVDQETNKSYPFNILIYPNITYSKNLEQDSYVVVTHNIIKELNKIRNDLFFTIISPKHIQSLDFHNTKQIYYDYPSYPNTMRIDFRTKELLKQLDWKNNHYDIIFSELPEHSLQLQNLLYNVTNIQPNMIGYTHWTEFPEITDYSKTVMPINFLGLLEMDKCGINTDAQKQLILKNAKTFFNEKIISKLDDILSPMYLGWEVPNYEKKSNSEKVIVFNHRPHKYKSYDWFLRQMDELWNKRKDFKVWVPLSNTNDREYIFNDKFDRFGYFSELSGCYVGVCGKQKYAGWSVSATDGMSVGVPYLFYDDGYYHELAGDAGIYFKTDDEFISNMNKILDSNEFQLEKSKQSVERFENNTWEKNIKQFDSMIDLSINKLKKLSEPTESYMKILNFIKAKGVTNKKEILDYMNWGVRISFTPYRNRLRTEDNITFTENKYIYNN